MGEECCLSARSNFQLVLANVYQAFPIADVFLIFSLCLDRYSLLVLTLLLDLLILLTLFILPMLLFLLQLASPPNSPSSLTSNEIHASFLFIIGHAVGEHLRLYKLNGGGYTSSIKIKGGGNLRPREAAPD